MGNISLQHIKAALLTTTLCLSTLAAVSHADGIKPTSLFIFNGSAGIGSIISELTSGPSNQSFIGGGANDLCNPSCSVDNSWSLTQDNAWFSYDVSAWASDIAGSHHASSATLTLYAEYQVQAAAPSNQIIINVDTFAEIADLNALQVSDEAQKFSSESQSYDTPFTAGMHTDTITIDITDAFNAVINAGGAGHLALRLSLAETYPQLLSFFNVGYWDVDAIIVEHDGDEDGLFGLADNCPLVANVNQEDLDADGMGDACDTDIDGDGLSNDDETNIYSTDPLLKDSDGDLWVDGDEVLCGSSPSLNTSVPATGDGCLILSDDTDHDGWSDVDENFMGGISDYLDPTSVPSDNDNDGIADEKDEDDDNDGLTDAEEITLYKTLPTVADTDGDLWLDGDEVLCFSDPKSDASVPATGIGCLLVDDDTDNDGWNDTDEDSFGSNAFDPTDIPSDIDQDGLHDLQDDDIDGDGIINADDNCEYDYDLNNVNTNADAFCDEETATENTENTDAPKFGAINSTDIMLLLLMATALYFGRLSRKTMT